MHSGELRFKYFYVVANTYLIVRSQLRTSLIAIENESKFEVFVLLGFYAA